jgi:hypothetical protein
VRLFAAVPDKEVFLLFILRMHLVDQVIDGSLPQHPDLSGEGCQKIVLLEKSPYRAQIRLEFGLPDPALDNDEFPSVHPENMLRVEYIRQYLP